MIKDKLISYPQYILPKKGLTLLAGLLANNQQGFIKNTIIKKFIKTYQVNMSEALIENPEDYLSFNDFFTRKLKPDARSIADSDVVSPVDGVVSEIGTIQKGQILQAKGREYALEQLLQLNAADCEKFINGTFATLYLSPKDYHRVHMPVDATLQNMTYVPGQLFSVQPATARTIPNLFARNERLVVSFDTSIGAMKMVLVGATIVGGIHTKWHGDVKRTSQSKHFIYPENAYDAMHYQKGQEMGYFMLGSTVIVIFEEKSNVAFLESLKPGSAVKFGEAMGQVK
tara:strand:- start:65 stop:919 length:855 start_codon:yes stop_codon:yes gene_type:complete